MPKLPLTVIIPTLNEERNLPKTLDSVVGWATVIKCEHLEDGVFVISAHPREFV